MGLGGLPLTVMIVASSLPMGANMFSFRSDTGGDSEKDILRCENGLVTYRYRDSKIKKLALSTVSGATFLWLVLQHVLPKGFRRSRNHGFLHPNSKRLIALLKLLVFKLAPASAATPTPRPQLLCTCCGSPMVVIRRRILPAEFHDPDGDMPRHQELAL